MLAFNVIMHLRVNSLISIFQWLNPSLNRASKVRMHHKYFLALSHVRLRSPFEWMMCLVPVSIKQKTLYFMYQRASHASACFLSAVWTVFSIRLKGNAMPIRHRAIPNGGEARGARKLIYFACCLVFFHGFCFGEINYNQIAGLDGFMWNLKSELGRSVLFLSALLNDILMYFLLGKRSMKALVPF